MADQETIDKIRSKVEAGIEITDEEEFIYLTEFMGHSEHEARTMITIANNTDKGAFID